MVSPLRHTLIALSKSSQMQKTHRRHSLSAGAWRGASWPAKRWPTRSRRSAPPMARACWPRWTTWASTSITKAEASVNADEYIHALQAIQQTGVDANISIKLTAMGLAVDDEFCYHNVRRIVQTAAELDNFVRIDMEDSPVTDRTLAIYRRLHSEFGNVGVVIQAYLYRSEEDVRSLMEQGMAQLRLCKGAYDEPPAVAFQPKPEVDQNMARLIQLMLDSQAQFPGTFPAVASHDHRIINWTKAYAHHHGIAPDHFEFQMLYGIRRDLQQQLADQGYRMRVYIPYGTRWYPYFMRRLAERPANLLFFARALVGQ
jgi:proline dehydrogenase